MLLSLVGLIAALSLFQRTQGQADPVKVTVFYESLCPDSIRFFTTQLEPTYEVLHDIMQVETHAYGKASNVARPNGEGYVFTCQHGQDECYGNKVIGCGKQYITDHDTFLKYDFCIMGATRPPAAGSQCAFEVEQDYSVIETCANSTEGENILHNEGLVEAELAPELDYVPWIIINDEYTPENQNDAESDLTELICRKYQGVPPSGCSAEL